jgi:putative transcriptional regulator
MENLENLLNIKNGAPASGRFLISEPFLYDINFKRSVILLCEHNKNGSLGFILNRQLDITLKDVMDIDTVLDIPLYMGGPVQNDTLHYIHRERSLASSSIEIASGLFWGIDFQQIVPLLENNTLDVDNFRFFLGYSGWGAGQLEDELAINSWFVTPANARLAFEEDYPKLWKTLLKNMGGTYKVLSNSPESPMLN